VRAELKTTISSLEKLLLQKENASPEIALTPERLSFLLEKMAEIQIIQDLLGLYQLERKQLSKLYKKTTKLEAQLPANATTNRSGESVDISLDAAIPTENYLRTTLEAGIGNLRLVMNDLGIEIPARKPPPDRGGDILMLLGEINLEIRGLEDWYQKATSRCIDIRDKETEEKIELSDKLQAKLEPFHAQPTYKTFSERIRRVKKELRMLLEGTATEDDDFSFSEDNSMDTSEEK